MKQSTAHNADTAEEWRDVVGYEGLYQVSNLGRVRSVERTIICSDGRVQHWGSKILSQGYSRQKYLVVILANAGIHKTAKVHRLVAQAFIPNPDSLPMVNHKDEVKDNNHVDNLEWCTQEYNNAYNDGHKKKGESRRKFYSIPENRAKVRERCRKYMTPVVQLNSKGEYIREWGSMHEVTRELGLRSGCICNNCKGRSLTCGGFIWKYKSDYEKELA